MQQDLRNINPSILTRKDLILPIYFPERTVPVKFVDPTTHTIPETPSAIVPLPPSWTTFVNAIRNTGNPVDPIPDTFWNNAEQRASARVNETTEDTYETPIVGSKCKVIFVSNGSTVQFESVSEDYAYRLRSTHIPVKSIITFIITFELQDGNFMVLAGVSPTLVTINQTKAKDCTEKLPGLTTKEEEKYVFEAFCDLAPHLAVLQKISIFLALFKVCKVYASRTNKHARFAKAIDCYLDHLDFIQLHTFGAQDFMYYAVESGIAHESAATKRSISQEEIKYEKHEALRVYKKAAEMSLTGHPMGTQMQGHTFNCWAVALRRAGYLDMAERAYVWGICDTVGATVTDKIVTLFSWNNLAIVKQQMSSESKRNDEKMIKRNVRHENNHGAPSISRGLECGNCEAHHWEDNTNESMQRCGGCRRVSYCSVDCQRSHWKVHKEDCKKWKKLTR